MSDEWRSRVPKEASVRTESSKYNQSTKEKQLIHEERNTAENWRPIMDAIKSGRGRDIHDEPKRKGPCIVVSSGPSLDDHIERLRDWRGGIVCSTSHATTLMHYGIEPDYIIVLDPFCAWHEISGVDWSRTKTRMVLNPSVWPDLVANWPNDMLFFLQNIGRRDSFYATTQLHMFCRRDPDDAKMRTPKFHPQIRTELILFACTPPAQIFCAGIIGYSRCFLSGFDFACSPKLSRFTRWQPDASGKWVEDVSPFKPKEYTVLTDNGLASEAIHLYYKKNFLSAWRLSRQELHSMDNWTCATEIPHVDIDDVIRRQGEGFTPLPKDEIIERTEAYLAKVGAYIIRRPDDSVSFVETANPLNDLPIYMANGRRIWGCLKCKTVATANDDTDHSGETCQVCGNVGMKRTADVDIVENMERIKRLVAGVPKVETVPMEPPVGCAESRIDGSVLTDVATIHTLDRAVGGENG
jgi:hypothetical protein